MKNVWHICGGKCMSESGFDLAVCLALKCVTLTSKGTSHFMCSVWEGHGQGMEEFIVYLNQCDPKPVSPHQSCPHAMYYMYQLSL